MLPKSVVIQNRIVQDIACGKFPKGSRIPSRNNLCRKFDCSRTTVERAVAELEMDGWIVSRKGSGTVVLSDSPERVLKRVYAVAPDGYSCISGDSDNPFPLFSEDTFDLPVVWIKSSSAQERAAELAAPGGAVIWMLPGEEQLAVMDFLRARRVPQILVNRHYRDYNCVYTDPVPGIREGLTWLMVEAGRNLGFVSYSPDTSRPYLPERIIAFYEQCVELGARVQPGCLFSRPFLDIPGEIAAAGTVLFRSANRPRGIFVLSGELAIPLLMCAAGHGLKPGRDFFLLVFDRHPSLSAYPGIAMLRQQQDLFALEILRWLKGGGVFSGEPFRAPVPTEFLPPSV